MGGKKHRNYCQWDRQWNSIYFRWISFSTIQYYAFLFFFTLLLRIKKKKKKKTTTVGPTLSTADNDENEVTMPEIRLPQWRNVCVCALLMLLLLALASISLVCDCQRNEFFISPSEEEWNEEKHENKADNERTTTKTTVFILQSAQRLCRRLKNVKSIKNNEMSKLTFTEFRMTHANGISALRRGRARR